MNVQFDPTISLGTLGSVVIFLGGTGFALFRLGIYTSTLNHLLRRFEDFMMESKSDRKEMRTKIIELEEKTEERHVENKNKLAAIFRKLLIPDWNGD